MRVVVRAVCWAAPCVPADARTHHSTPAANASECPETKPDRDTP